VSEEYQRELEKQLQEMSKNVEDVKRSRITAVDTAKELQYRCECAMLSNQEIKDKLQQIQVRTHTLKTTFSCVRE
jgi:hypothetical protein